MRVRWTLLPWIRSNMLNFDGLLNNSNSTDYLLEIFEGLRQLQEMDPIRVCANSYLPIEEIWSAISGKPNSAYVFEKNKEFIIWSDVKNDKMILRHDVYIMENDIGVSMCERSCINAILLRHPDFEICWWSLSINPHAIDILRANPQSIVWWRLCSNTNARDLLMEEYERGGDMLMWQRLSSNPCARDILIMESTRVPCRITDNLYDNTNVPELIEPRITGEMSQSIKHSLSANPSIVHLMLKNTHNIFWPVFLRNPGVPALVQKIKHLIPHRLLCRYGELIDYNGTITSNINNNESAMDFLSKNQHHIQADMFSSNPAIFELDFKRASVERTTIIRDELMARALTPERVARWHAAGVDLSTI